MKPEKSLYETRKKLRSGVIWVYETTLTRIVQHALALSGGARARSQNLISPAGDQCAALLRIESVLISKDDKVPLKASQATIFAESAGVSYGRFIESFH
jgi:hypothetical protein